MKRVAILSLAISLVAAAIVSRETVAHAGLVSASPAPSSVVLEPPARLMLEFSQNLAQGTDVFVRGPDGSLASANDLVTRDRQASIGLRAAGPGVYRVNWRTVSAEDGDEANGTFQFGVGAAGSVTPSAEATEEVHEHDERPVWQIAGGIVLVLSLVAATVAFVIIRRRRPAPA